MVISHYFCFRPVTLMPGIQDLLDQSHKSPALRELLQATGWITLDVQGSDQCQTRGEVFTQAKETLEDPLEDDNQLSLDLLF